MEGKDVTYRLYQNGTEINTIVADEDFVTRHCERLGYTFQRLEQPPAEQKPDRFETLRADVDYLLMEKEAELDAQ